MTIHKIIAASGYGSNGAYTKSPGGIIHRHTWGLDPGYTDGEASGWNEQTDADFGNWALGTGQVIETTGIYIFNSETFGGSLSNALIACTGGTAYVGFNCDSISISSGMRLGNGESFIYDGEHSINKIWALTQIGTAILYGNGLVSFNRNTI